jgi:hypothetical protein
MGIREVLQIEIWSKEASRKILKRTWKVLKYVGIGLGVLVAGVALFVFVETHWLTARERSTGVTALAQVDALQNFDGMSDAEFDVKVRQAEEKVDAANHAVLTAKDNEVAGCLHFYLDQIKWTRLSEKRMHKLLSLHPEYVNSERYKESDLSIEKSNRDYIKIWKDASHQSLDK